ncbi:MAG: hypothetical protein H6815_01030 [Phycisphaeraceae bacterium]|nr:hypothetical protein [Phycisphaerales bacterium]MCB9859009.1 hypothetical protein [Phycisphaeraceae bacterium]
MARRRVPLPFPDLTAAHQCAQCDYNLAGLEHVEHCPECGTAFGPESHMRIVGIPQRSETVLWRRIVWGILIIVGAVLSQTWMYFFASSAMKIVGIVFLVLLAATTGMLLTSRQKSKPTEKITFAWAGIGRREWGRQGAKTELMEWPQEVAVQIITVSTVWQRLIIKTIEMDGESSVFFACGFKCRKEHIPWVQSTIEALQRGEPVPVGPIDITQT